MLSIGFYHATSDTPIRPCPHYLCIDQVLSPSSSPFHVASFLPSSEDEYDEKCVSVMLEGEETEMVFIDHPHSEISVSGSKGGGHVQMTSAMRWRGD